MGNANDSCTARPVAVLFANLKGNIGDFAILEAVLHDIRSRYPIQPLHVLSHGFLPIDEDRLEQFRKAAVPEFQIAGTTPFTRVWPPSKRLLRFGVWPLVQAGLVRRFRDQHADAAKRFANYEAIAIVGGDHWNGMDLGVSMFGFLEAVAATGTKIVTYPFSLNPAVLRFNSRDSLRRYFSRIQGPLPLRDTISMDTAKRSALSADYRPDCVFSLQGLAQAVNPAPERNSKRILLAITGTGRHSTYEANRIVLQSLTRRVHLQELELLTTCWPEDLEGLEELRREFSVHVRAPMTWQGTVAEFRASSAIVTNRLHALILGSMVGSVLVPLADRAKSEAFARDARLVRVARHLDEISEELISSALIERDEISAKCLAFSSSSRDMFRSPFESKS